MLNKRMNIHIFVEVINTHALDAKHCVVRHQTHGTKKKKKLKKKKKIKKKRKLKKKEKKKRR